MIKNIKDFIFEASRNAKRRNIDIAKKLYIKGHELAGIKTFAILTSQNPNSEKFSRDANKKLLKDFKTNLKRDHVTFVPIQGHYAGNIENSYMLFNVNIDVVKEYAGMYEQTSFFFCYPTNKGDVMNEYWEKSNTNEPYNSETNDYVLINKTEIWKRVDTDDDYTIIGKNFKYNIDPSVFDRVNDKIEENLKTIKTTLSHDMILEWAYNRVGQKSSYYKQILSSNIIS